MHEPPEKIAKSIVIRTLQEISTTETGPRADMALTILLEMSVERMEAYRRAGETARDAFISLTRQLTMAIKPIEEFAKGFAGESMA